MMQPFDQLTPAGKLRRKHRLAKTALAQYGFTDAKLSLLRDVDNTLYRVQARDGQRFLLRLHTLNRHSPAELHGELAWLSVLRRDTALRVPEPVAIQDGAFFVDVAVAGVPEPRRCVLLHWLPGQARNHTMQPRHIERVGAFMAQMHTHAEQYQPPAQVMRRPWDWARLFDHQSPLWHKGPAMFNHKDMVVLRATADRIAAALQALGTARHVYGMIHSDLNFSNVLFHNEQVGAIDFEECGPGYYLFDHGSNHLGV